MDILSMNCRIIKRFFFRYRYFYHFSVFVVWFSTNKVFLFFYYYYCNSISDGINNDFLR